MSDFFVTPWTIAHQAPLSMGFSRQEYWSRLPFPPPGDLSDSEIELVSLALAGGFFTTESPIQELNPGLLLCRRILYQLSYEGRIPVNLPTKEVLQYF